MGSNPFVHAEHVGTSIVKSGAGLSVVISEADGLAGKFLREIVACGMWVQKKRATRKKGSPAPQLKSWKDRYKDRKSRKPEDGLTGSDRAILVAMCNFILAHNVTSSGEPYVFPSHRTLQRLTGLGRAAIQARLEALEAMGILTTHAKGDGTNRSIYILHFATRNLKWNAKPTDATETAAAELRGVKTAPPPTLKTDNLFDGGRAVARSPSALEDAPPARPSAPEGRAVARSPSALEDAPPARCSSDTLSMYSAAAATAALRQTASAVNSPDSLVDRFYPDISAEHREDLKGRMESLSEGKLNAVILLTEKGVAPLDGIGIVNDRRTHIADEKFCDIINRISATRTAKGNLGGWWRVALQNHLQYGADPVARAIETDRARTPSPEQKVEGFEAIGRRILKEKSDEEVEQIRHQLIDIYLSQGKDLAAKILGNINNPANSIQFWGVLGKNADAMGLLTEVRS